MSRPEPISVRIESSHRLPDVTDLADLHELREALRALDGVTTRSGRLPSPSGSQGSPQNAIDWSEMIISLAVGLPAQVVADTIATVLCNWLRKRQTEGVDRSLVLTVGEIRLELHDPTEKDRKRAFRVLERIAETSPVTTDDQ